MFFNVQTINRHRLQTDGKGVTTLVALKGCPLRCRYCINQDLLSTDRNKVMSPEELWQYLSIDYCYFLATGGGVTFGGGESLLYAKEIISFTKIIPTGVTINVETSLNVDLPDEVFDLLTEKVDRFIVDIKTLDAKTYFDYTGRDNALTNMNLERFISRGLQNKVHIRIPVIPDFKTKEKALEEEKFFQGKGFNDTEVFDYVIRDYMKL